MAKNLAALNLKDNADKTAVIIASKIGNLVQDLIEIGSRCIYI